MFSQSGSHIWKWSFKTGNFVLLFTKQCGLWLGMTGGLSTQVKMNVKPIGAFKSGLIRQVVINSQDLYASLLGDITPFFMLLTFNVLRFISCPFEKYNFLCDYYR